MWLVIALVVVAIGLASWLLASLDRKALARDTEQARRVAAWYREQDEAKVRHRNAERRDEVRATIKRARYRRL